MAFFKQLDELSGITDITWNDRKRLGPLDKASQQIMRGKSSFSPAQKEVFAAYVSGLNACKFCYGSHAAVAKNFGIPHKMIEALIQDIDTAPVNANEKSLSHYLKNPRLSARKLVQEDVDMVFEAGWCEQDLQDVILIACLFNFYNRLLDGHGIKGNQAIYEFVAEHLHKKGYSVPWFIGLIKNLIKKTKIKKLQSLEAE